MTAWQPGNIDIMRRERTPSTGPTEYYITPHSYAITVGTSRISLSPDGRRMPAVTLSVLAAIANTGIISIGDSAVTVPSGFELDAGKGVTYSTAGYQYIGGMSLNPEQYTRAGLFRILLDINNFFVIATAANQSLRIFWSESVRVP